jgi:thiamine biosynthesis lipoprotein
MKRGRRRFLRVLAAMSGVALVHRHGLAREGRFLQPKELRSWRGAALGADAHIQIAHEDASEGARILAACRVEIESIEKLFSLHREDSVISRLNIDGEVADVSGMFLDLLSVSKNVHAVTSGYFDPSVQPLWRAYTSATKRNIFDEKKLLEEISKCRDQIGLSDVALAAGIIKFNKPGMALTMNGIAQGYLTDRIIAALRRAGIRSALVETGETYGLGTHPDGRAWRLGVPNPLETGQLTRVVSLDDRAVATSAPSGTTFERTGRFHHLFDPYTGHSANEWSSVTVTAPSATVADALSTAFSAMPRSMVLDAALALPDVGIHMVDMDGGVTSYGVI